MLFAMVLWGFSWPSGKIAGTYAPVPVLVFWRFFFSSLCMVPILRILKIRVALPPSALIYVAGGGILITLYNFLFFQGTHLGLAGAGGILVTSLNPIFTVLFSALLLGHAIYRKDYVGLLLGITGGAIMIQIWSLSFSDLFHSGNLFFVLASGTWAFLTILSSRSRPAIHPLLFSFWIYVIAGLLCLVPAFSYDPGQIFKLEPYFWFHFMMLSIGAMAIGTTIFFVGSTRLGPGKASSFIFAVPVAAMGFSMFFLGEILTPNLLIGGVFSMAAVYLISVRK